MKIKYFLSIVLMSVVVFTSCKKELEPQESSPTADATIATTANPTATPNGQNPTGQMQMQPNMTTATSAPVTTAPGMNPPHGQPNHRCDISVGAPLNSPVAKPAAPQQNQVTTTISPSSTPGATITPAAVNADGSISVAPTTSSAPAILQAPVDTPAGMNPPHGQAGHVCGVAVGAPLPK